MVKWTILLQVPLTLVTLSVYSANYLVNAIETSALPSTIASPTVPSSITPQGNKRVPKQVGGSGGGGAAVVNGKDHQQAETGFGFGHGHGHGHGLGHHGHGDGKYFQYAHNPANDEYEYGYRRGNDYHFQERYEKYGPHWNFKTKVKWGDKYGGYGEHYWDYNHAGNSHDDGHGGGSGGGGGGSGGGGGHGHYSEPVPTYEEAQSSDKRLSMIAKRENSEKMEQLQKQQTRQQKMLNHESKRTAPSNKVQEQDNQDSQAAQSQDRSHQRLQQREMNYRQSQIPRPRPTQKQSESVAEPPPSLVLDPRSGRVIDETTGKAYWLRPARN